MTEFLEVMTGYPTVILTVLMGLVLLYWLMVIFGAVDVEVPGLDGLVESVDGAVEGFVDGAVEGAAEGLLDGAADGAVDAALDGAADAAGEGAAEALDAGEPHGAAGLAHLLSLLKLNGVPVTIVVSALVLWAWVLTGLTIQLLGDRLGQGWLRHGLATLVLLGTGFVALLATSITVRPFRNAFRGSVGRSRRSFVGKPCTITTGRVTATFGQAEVDDEGSSLRIPVRCFETNTLRRGSRALIYDYQADEEVFLVSAHDED